MRSGTVAIIGLSLCAINCGGSDCCKFPEAGLEANIATADAGNMGLAHLCTKYGLPTAPHSLLAFLDFVRKTDDTPRLANAVTKARSIGTSGTSFAFFASGLYSPCSFVATSCSSRNLVTSLPEFSVRRVYF